MKLFKVEIYDTGNGLTVAPELDKNCLIPIVDLVNTKYFTTKTPAEYGLDKMWDIKWEAQKNILRMMVDAFNEKYAKDFDHETT